MLTVLSRYIVRVKNKLNVYSAAFTIVELLVAMALFVILISIAVASFVRALQTERAIASLIDGNTNASLVLEQIGRELRTGYDFQIISNREIQFTNARAAVIRYRQNGNAIERGVQIGTDFSYNKITSDTVYVAGFKVILLDQTGSLGYPPRITMSISLAPVNHYLTNFVTTVQTTISARNI